MTPMIGGPLDGEVLAVDGGKAFAFADGLVVHGYARAKWAWWHVWMKRCGSEEEAQAFVLAGTHWTELELALMVRDAEWLARLWRLVPPERPVSDERCD